MLVESVRCEIFNEREHWEPTLHPTSVINNFVSGCVNFWILLIHNSSLPLSIVAVQLKLLTAEIVVFRTYYNASHSNRFDHRRVGAGRGILPSLQPVSAQDDIAASQINIE